MRRGGAWPGPAGAGLTCPAGTAISIVPWSPRPASRSPEVASPSSPSSRNAAKRPDRGGSPGTKVESNPASAGRSPAVRSGRSPAASPGRRHGATAIHALTVVTLSDDHRDRPPRPSTETGHRDRPPRPATETGHRDRPPDRPPRPATETGHAALAEVVARRGRERLCPPRNASAAAVDDLSLTIY